MKLAAPVDEADSWVTLTCGHCGKASAYSAWCKTPVFGELPDSEFQCPNCQRAFTRRRTGQSYPYPAIECAPISSRL